MEIVDTYVFVERRVMLALPQENPFGNEFQERLGTCSVEPPVLDTNFVTKADFHLLGDAFGNSAGSVAVYTQCACLSSEKYTRGVV